MSLTCRCECINNLIISPFIFSEAMDILDEFNGEHGDGEGPCACTRIDQFESKFALILLHFDDLDNSFGYC